MIIGACEVDAKEEVLHCEPNSLMVVIGLPRVIEAAADAASSVRRDRERTPQQDIN